jgi:glyoxylase-like metal-dependent hydrolase (beta-lactamase superfamily II)
VLFTGDVLFCQSIGRTDFPDSNHTQLITAIREKLFALPDDTTVYPGHSEKTTIGFEKRYNIYLR